MALKQVILVRMDLKLPKGKLAAQVAHASLEAALKSGSQKVAEWRRDGAKKVVLQVKDLEELKWYQKRLTGVGIKTSLIIDAGKTFLEPGTTTCLGVGPDIETNLDNITGQLKLLN